MRYWDVVADRADSLETRWRVKLLHGVNRLYTRCYHSVEVKSPPSLPREGPAILVSNHISGLDPLVIQSVINRPIVWMMAREYYEIQSLKWFFKLIEAIPVERSGQDLAAARAGLRALARGHLLGIFPEGRFATSRELLSFQTGVSLIAIRSRVPVHYCAIEGTSRGLEMLTAFLKPRRMQIAFGNELAFDRSSLARENLELVTESIRQKVVELRKNKLDKINRL